MTAGLSNAAVCGVIEGLRARSSSAIEAQLHQDAIYTVRGFAPLQGRRAIVEFFRRLFTQTEEFRVNITRQVADGDVILSAERRLIVLAGRSSVASESLVVYGLAEGLVRTWDDALRAEDLDDHTQTVGRRLRAARW